MQWRRWRRHLQKGHGSMASTQTQCKAVVRQRRTGTGSHPGRSVASTPVGDVARAAHVSPAALVSLAPRTRRLREGKGRGERAAYRQLVATVVMARWHGEAVRTSSWQRRRGGSRVRGASSSSRLPPSSPMPAANKGETPNFAARAWGGWRGGLYRRRLGLGARADSSDEAREVWWLSELPSAKGRRGAAAVVRVAVAIRARVRHA